MKQYLTNGINNTPTLAAPAAVQMDECRGKAVKFDAEGNIVLCDTAGEKVLGIVTIDNDVTVEQGDNVSVQIKDNGVAVAGGDVAIGDELATDANGKFVTAAAGQYVRAIALEAGAADRIIRVMMANYVSAGASVKKKVIKPDEVLAQNGVVAVPYTDEAGTVHNEIILDLSGQTLTGPADGSAIIVEEGGILTLKGDGLISSAYKSAVIDVLPGAELIMESGAIEATGADSAHAIKVQGTATINGGTINAIKGNGIFVSNEGAKLVINGGEISGLNAAVIGNGNQKGTIIEINGGTLNNAAGTAIYHPQDGELIINDGEIVGVVGVEIRAGKLNVSGGQIAGTGEFGIEPNGNGSTVTGGCAVAVSQHSTNKDINVEISDGTFNGAYALYEADVQAEPSDNIFMSISGGTFNGDIYSENVTGFITGGNFTTDVSKYMA